VVSTKAARTVNRKWPRFGGAFLETSIDAWEGKMLPFPWSPERPLSRERDLFPGTRFVRTVARNIKRPGTRAGPSFTYYRSGPPRAPLGGRGRYGLQFAPRCLSWG
jgi:hypothetical protein